MTERYTIERYESRADWLRQRKRSIGASEAAAVLGYSRFHTGYSVATDKLTEAIDTSPMSEEAAAGIRHEPTIAKWFAEQVKMDREPEVI